MPLPADIDIERIQDRLSKLILTINHMAVEGGATYVEGGATYTSDPDQTTVRGLRPEFLKKVLSQLAAAVLADNGLSMVARERAIKNTIKDLKHGMIQKTLLTSSTKKGKSSSLDPDKFMNNLVGQCQKNLAIEEHATRVCLDPPALINPIPALDLDLPPAAVTNKKGPL